MNTSIWLTSPVADWIIASMANRKLLVRIVLPTAMLQKSVSRFARWCDGQGQECSGIHPWKPFGILSINDIKSTVLLLKAGRCFLWQCARIISWTHSHWWNSNHRWINHGRMLRNRSMMRGFPSCYPDCSTHQYDARICPAIDNKRHKSNISNKNEIIRFLSWSRKQKFWKCIRPERHSLPSGFHPACAIWNRSPSYLFDDLAGITNGYRVRRYVLAIHEWDDLRVPCRSRQPWYRQ